MSAATLRSLQRRLERAELHNLREAVAALAVRVDELEARLAAVEYERDAAWADADCWYQLLMDAELPPEITTEEPSHA